MWSTTASTQEVRNDTITASPIAISTFPRNLRVSKKLTRDAGIEHGFHRPSSNHHHATSVSQSYSMHHQPQHWNYMTTGVYGQGYPNNPSM